VHVALHGCLPLNFKTSFCGNFWSLLHIHYFKRSVYGFA
jgi:hypothetical protein